MSPRLSATLLAVAAALSLPFAAPAQQLQPVERIAAIVDEDVVLQSELDLAMEEPGSFDAAHLRAEKEKVLAAVRLPGPVTACSARGRYAILPTTLYPLPAILSLWRNHMARGLTSRLSAPSCAAAEKRNACC